MDRRHQVDPGMNGKSLCHRQTVRGSERVTGPALILQHRGPRFPRSQPQNGKGVVHQHLIPLADPIPLEHGKLGRVQRPALAVAPDMGKGVDPGFPRRQQFLHRKLGRGVQIHRVGNSVIPDGLGGKPVQMRLVSGADGKGRRIHFGKALGRQPDPDGALYPVARQQQRPAVSMARGGPPGTEHRRRGVCRHGARY